MRVIKFRAWHRLEKKMYSMHDLLFAQVEGKWLWDYVRNVLDVGYYKDPHLELMRYTSLLDKRNKEIYESDIILSDGGSGWVVWDSTRGQWQLQSFAWWLPLCDAQNPEILGNTKEHWHLMEGKTTKEAQP